MTIPVYDPAKVILSIGGQPVVGFMDGTYITASRDEDAWMLMVGVKGEAAIARNRNEAGKIVFTLLQTSPSNAILTAKMNLHLAAGVPIGPSSLSDVFSSTDIGGADSFILKPAEVTYAKEIQGREWTVIIPNMRFNVGSAA